MQRKCKLYVMEKDAIIKNGDGAKVVVTDTLTGIRPLKGYDVVSEKTVMITVPDNDFYNLAISVGSIQEIEEEHE